MYCSRQGINCEYCGVFGECHSSACVARLNELSIQRIPDNSDFQLTQDINTIPDELEINGVKYRKVEDKNDNA